MHVRLDETIYRIFSLVHRTTILSPDRLFSCRPKPVSKVRLPSCAGIDPDRHIQMQIMYSDIMLCYGMKSKTKDASCTKYFPSEHFSPDLKVCFRLVLDQ